MYGGGHPDNRQSVFGGGYFYINNGVALSFISGCKGFGLATKWNEIVNSLIRQNIEISRKLLPEQTVQSTVESGIRSAVQSDAGATQSSRVSTACTPVSVLSQIFIS